MQVVVLQKPLFTLICMFTTSFTGIVVTVAAIVMLQYVDRLYCCVIRSGAVMTKCDNESIAFSLLSDDHRNIVSLLPLSI